MSSIAVTASASGTGTVSLVAPVTNTNQTLTLPDQTATLITDSAAILNIGSGQVYKDASGNVGIGTNSPSFPLDVAGAIRGNSWIGRANTSAPAADAFIYRPADGTLGFGTGSTERARIDSSGNVGIGTSSPTNKLHVSSSSFETIKLQGTSTVSGINFVNSASSNGYIYYDNGPNMLFYTNGSERARIASDGAFLIGKTTVDDTTEGFIYRASKYLNLVRDGNPPLNLTRLSSDGQLAEFRRGSTQVGNISVTTSNTAYNTSSDYRLKEDIVPMTGALAKVVALKPCTYKWKADGSDGQGFIAHEIDEVVPGCVTGEKDAVQEEQYEVTPAVKDEEGNTVTEAVMGTRTVPKYQSIDTSFLVATLTAAIQELKAIVDAQSAEIAALKGAT